MSKLKDKLNELAEFIPSYYNPFLDIKNINKVLNDKSIFDSFINKLLYNDLENKELVVEFMNIARDYMLEMEDLSCSRIEDYGKFITFPIVQEILCKLISLKMATVVPLRREKVILSNLTGNKYNLGYEIVELNSTWYFYSSVAGVRNIDILAEYLNLISEQVAIDLDCRIIDEFIKSESEKSSMYKVDKLTRTELTRWLDRIDGCCLNTATLTLLGNPVDFAQVETFSFDEFTYKSGGAKNGRFGEGIIKSYISPESTAMVSDRKFSTIASPLVPRGKILLIPVGSNTGDSYYCLGIRNLFIPRFNFVKEEVSMKPSAIVKFQSIVGAGNIITIC